MSLSPQEEELLKTPYVVGLIQKYTRTATLLRPSRSATPLSVSQSKFGGVANMAGFIAYPCCDTCKTPLNFVLQLYKKHFPAFYFPDNTDLFQLYRCPNTNCPDAYDMRYDQKMFVWYFNTEDLAGSTITKPAFTVVDAENEVPDCTLNPVTVNDIPNYDDMEPEDIYYIEKELSPELQDALMEKFFATLKTKFNGYPGYIQSPNHPICSCGKTKEFFFQLSSLDIEEHYQDILKGDVPAHTIMIGDMGNIYFYVCKTCGPHTIETNYDCY